MIMQYPRSTMFIMTMFHCDLCMSNYNELLLKHYSPVSVYNDHNSIHGAVYTTSTWKWIVNTFGNSDHLHAGRESCHLTLLSHLSQRHIHNHHYLYVNHSD